jgi:hypothetical protein
VLRDLSRIPPSGRQLSSFEQFQNHGADDNRQQVNRLRLDRRSEKGWYRECERPPTTFVIAVSGPGRGRASQVPLAAIQQPKSSEASAAHGWPTRIAVCAIARVVRD